MTDPKSLSAALLPVLATAFPGWGLPGPRLPAQGTPNPSFVVPPAETAATTAARATVLAEVVRKAKAFVVHVEVEVQAATPYSFARPSSGVVVDPGGLVLTWWYLVAECEGATDKLLFVHRADDEGKRHEVRILAHDEASGLALLQFAEAPAAPLPYVELADSSRLLPGEPCVLVAHHDGKERSAFGGAASRALGPTTIGGRTIPAADLLLTDTLPDQRTDGAALLDAAGRLLGLCGAEHVLNEIGEPRAEDYKKPHFQIALAADRIRAAFAERCRAAKAANATLSAPPSADPAQDRVRKDHGGLAVARVQPSVVAVLSGPVDSASQGSLLGELDPGAVRRHKGVGSGVVIAKSGLVVTNRHLLVDKQTITVRWSDGTSLPAKLLEDHMGSNLALLKVEPPAGKTLPAAVCAPDDDGIVGEPVFAVGNPLGTTPTLTAGVLSQKRGNGRLQIDANIGNATGGGALVDRTGRLLGIVDGGRVDKAERAGSSAEQGEEVKAETNLNFLHDIATVRKVFADEIGEHAAADESIRAPVAATAAEIERRRAGTAGLVEQFARACVGVFVSRTSRAEDPDNPFAEVRKEVFTPHGLGSGVIVAAEGLAISNWHVVDEAALQYGEPSGDHKVRVRLWDGRDFEADVLSISREDDLSLLQLRTKPGETLPWITLGDAKALQVGEGVVAIGSPHGLVNTVTAGLLAAKDQGIKVRGRWAKLDNLLEPDAAINPGNSGGALLDMVGRLVGINSAGGRGLSSRGYSIPVDHVRRQLPLLLSPEKLRSRHLGLRAGDQEGAVVIASVETFGPAQRAELRSGDRIVAIDGQMVTWYAGFALALLRSTGKTVKLGLERRGTPLTVELEPVPAAAWAVVRQTGLELRPFEFREAPELVRQSCIAMHKKWVGAGEPPSIPDQVLRVERLHPMLEGRGIEVGDLFLAVELGAGSASSLRPLLRVEDAQALFNDRELSTYEGTRFKCWLARKGEIAIVELVGKRLMP